MSNTRPTHADWIGRTVHGANGEKIGDVTNVYADDGAWKRIEDGKDELKAKGQDVENGAQPATSGGDGSQRLASDGRTS